MREEHSIQYVSSDIIIDLSEPDGLPVASRHRERHIGWEQSELAARGRYARTLSELAALFPMLTTAELRVCTLLKNLLSDTMMAELLGVRTKTIENHKRNIRRKLRLSVETSLQDYLLSLPSKREKVSEKHN